MLNWYAVSENFVNYRRMFVSVEFEGATNSATRGASGIWIGNCIVMLDLRDDGHSLEEESEELQSSFRTQALQNSDSRE